MGTSGKNDSLSVPPDLLAEVEATAERERRSSADVLRDALESYLACRRWDRDAAQDRAKARELGLPDDDAPPSAEYRRSIREKIAAGLASARAGRLLDGEDVFASIHAELDEIERQSRG